jgi:Ca-activated chloride channel homolog
MKHIAAALFLAPFAAAYIVLAGCSGSGGGGGEAPTAASADTLTVLAGSELKDLEPYLDQIRQKTGVTLTFDYSGTLSGIDRINAGESFDAAWFSQASYMVLSDSQHHIKAQAKIMLSPVVLGVKSSKTAELGWAGNKNVTWKDIAAAASAGRLKYAMTNPTASNSGFSAVIGVVSALAGTADVLKPNDVRTARLNGFFSGQRLTAGSSGWLIDSYVRDQDSLDGIINYEANLLSLNAGGQLKEPLVLIYPKEGIVTADYPLILLNAEKRAQYDKVVAYLKGDEFQRILMEKTFRRPANPDVALSADFPKNLIVDLPFPGSISTINEILRSYLNNNRIPPHSFFVLDTSGSMEGERISGLQHALDTLAGDDPSITGQFAKFENREKITIFTFNSTVSQPINFEMHSENDTQTLQGVKDFASGLQAGGNTAIFDAVEAAEDLAQRWRATDGPRYYSIVLMTDGESNTGDDFNAFKRRYDSLPADERAIKVFPVIFGEASPEQLTQLANLTGGRTFDGSHEPLSVVFKEIRGYQ